MKQYLDTLSQILSSGQKKIDRTGTGTLSLFGTQMRFNLGDGFPAVTTKKLAWKAVVSELLWFLEGSSDENRLKEILYDDPNTEKNTIWTANAQAEYWKPHAKYPGDLGRIYGVQWREWRTPHRKWHHEHDYEYICIDQIKELIENIKNDPYSRRHILTAWNPAELSQMALPPCHVMSQFNVTDGKLSCQLYQRSQDAFLGGPFNIASYSLLTHMIAQVCNLGIGEFILTAGDCHVYLDHVDQVNIQLTRDPLPLPTLWLNPDIKDIFDFTMNDIKLIDYNSHPAIAAPMSV